MQLPDTFIQHIIRLLGEEEATLFFHSLQENPASSIRLNRSKLPTTSLNNIPTEWTVPWCPGGIYLKEKLTFTFDPLFHAGGYYVQEASSMFLAQIMKQYVTQPVTLLDLCAAPGGKSTLARDLLPEGSLLVSNELMPARARILVENLQKWGHPDVIITSASPSELGSVTSAFDVILTDVPCSGEGMFRKDPVAIQEWSPENVYLCERRQRDILRDIWNSLKPGGLLIYSTCTYNLSENEENIAWIVRELGAEALPVTTESGWNITGNLAHLDFPIYRFLPHRTRGEGLFMAVLRKTNALEPSLYPSARKPGKEVKERRKNKSSSATQKPPLGPMKEWLSRPGTENDEWVFSASTAGVYSAIRHPHFPTLQRLQESGVRILMPGVLLATQKGKDYIPHPALALSSVFNQAIFPQVALSYDQSLAYLRKESIQLPPDTPCGYILLTYHSLPLGFVKNIGSRNNNLYPSEWRIRSSYNPDEIRTLDHLSAD